MKRLILAALLAPACTHGEFYCDDHPSDRSYCDKSNTPAEQAAYDKWWREQEAREAGR